MDDLQLTASTEEATVCSFLFLYLVKLSLNRMQVFVLSMQMEGRGKDRPHLKGTAVLKN